MLNKVIIIGRLTDDPELRYTPNGTAVCNFTLAVERNFTNQQGERETDFIDVVVWRKQAENCAEYLGKGCMAAVEGRWQQRHYENDDEDRREVNEVVANNVQFLEYKDDAGESQAEQQSDDEDLEVPF